MRRYDSYKDSGVEWIGKIPNGWGLRKGSTIGKFSKGNGIKKDEVREVGLPCIRYGEIYTKYNHKIETVETFIEDGVTNVKVGKGTLFMTGSGELLEDIGKCVVYVGDKEIISVFNFSCDFKFRIFIQGLDIHKTIFKKLCKYQAVVLAWYIS